MSEREDVFATVELWLPDEDPKTGESYPEGYAALARIRAHVEALEVDLKQARDAIVTLATINEQLRAHVEALEGALRYLLMQVDTVERSSVIRESDTYRRARAALAGEPKRVFRDCEVHGVHWAEPPTTCPTCKCERGSDWCTLDHRHGCPSCPDPWHTVPTGTQGEVVGYRIEVDGEERVYAPADVTILATVPTGTTCDAIYVGQDDEGKPYTHRCILVAGHRYDHIDQNADLFRVPTGTDNG